jgi:nucleotide-binding universal stress UspA family protein
MLKIQTILAPTDFSHHAEAALRYACGLAARLGATLHLLHVLPDVVVPVGPDPSLISAYPPEYYEETETRARETLQRSLDPTWERPSAVEFVVRWGDPVDVIVAYATEKIDLIVIATHGRTGLSHVLLGSVAERIVRESPCPVLTIRNRETN